MSPTRRADRRGPLAQGAWLASLVAAAACGRDEVLGATGGGGDRIASLGTFLLVLAAIVFTGVMLVLAWAVLRRRPVRRDDGVDLSEPGTRWVLWGGAVMPAVVLGAIAVVGMAIMGATPAPRAAPVVTVEVIGHQWWWELRYTGPTLRGDVVTANELHLPVGQPVRLLLTSTDVIHSFWVPGLNGKLDLIPGDTNDLRLTAREPGRYTGQCAEYCGAQHAKMGLLVVAQAPADFQRWWGEQLQPRQPPHDSLALAGERLFVEGPCAMCHTVRGTGAQGQVAPDLTHIGSRAMLGANAIPNSPGYLAGWITNAQGIKPGVRMPPITFYDGPELQALVAYLQGLK
ncbi:MAG TPA: cytochrome c oxidase subunit II [Gemmatimonadaceae bacterium]